MALMVMSTVGLCVCVCVSVRLCECASVRGRKDCMKYIIQRITLTVIQLKETTPKSFKVVNAGFREIYEAVS